MNKENQTENSKLDQDDPGFFYRPQSIKWILRVFYVICGLLVLVDFFVHRHIETEIEKVPAFYPIYGFVACVLLVWLAAKMRTWIIREDKYYELHEEEGDTQQGGKH